MGTEATRARIAALYDAYRAGDMPTVMAGLSEDIAWRSVAEPPLPWCGSWRGHGGVTAYFTALAGTCRVTGLDIERILADGDWATVLATITVRYNGDATDYSYTKVDVLRVDGERVAEFREYYDTATIERDLGRANTARSG